ncbi:MAG: alpha-L-rhamnosidase N-terminal domain-containing protein [Bacteroidota bacterium]
MKKTVCLFVLSFISCLGQAQNFPINPDLLNKQWSASWIAHPTASRKEYGVFHFRRSFDLPTKPESFLVHVTADNRYRLFVNGKPVGAGPARGDKMHWRFETYDLSPHLQAGKNTLAAMVWNMGNNQPMAQQTWETGFLVQGNTEKESAVNTDATHWLVTQNLAYHPLPVTAAMVDNQYYAAGACDSVMAAKYPWGWEKAGFDDKNWQMPKAIRPGKPAYFPFGYGEGDANLVPRNIPLMEEKQERIPKIVRATGIKVDDGFLKGVRLLVIPAHTKATILLDQTYLTTAYPELLVSGGKGSQVRLYYAEALLDQNRKKGNRNETEGKRLVGYHDTFLPDGDQHPKEEPRLFRPLWFRTFRYVQLEVETTTEPLTIHEYYGMFIAYPFEQKATFTSNDPMLKNIWDISWRTARLCAHETYFDCPYYEQLQYVGDTRIQALISLHVAGDDRLVRNALTLYDHSRLSEGITQSRYPTDDAQMIPPFSLYWVAMVYDYHMYRNDPAFVKQFLPGIQGVLAWFEQHLDQHQLLSKLGWWNFVDWAPQFDRGVPTGAQDEKGTTIISLQYVYALDRAAEVFSYFGKTREAQYYRDVAVSIRKAVFNRCFDAQKQLFADTPEKKEFSQHANAMAILTDAIPVDQQASLMQKLLLDKTLIQCTIYYKFYLMNALKKAGLGNQYLDNLGIWKTMISEGLSTFAETDKDPRSDCHAWSASPMIELVATVCGIEPAEAGFKSVKIEPHLGVLKQATGRMPHPLGDILVKLTRKGAKGVSAEITLPSGLAGTFIWQGEKFTLKSGNNTINN